MKIILDVNGCDDTTSFELDVNEDEIKFLKTIVDKCNETRTYVCMPGMEITEIKEDK